MAFPRVNFVALLSAAMSLVSIFVYWWGYGTTGTLLFASSPLFLWSLWGGPSQLYTGSANSAQTLTSYSPVVGVLVIASVVLLLLGTLPRASRLMLGGSVLAIVAPVLYTIIVNTAISNACSGVANCISGPFGSRTIPAGPLTYTVSWGFQAGFYLEIVGAVLSILAIAFQHSFLSTKKP